MLNLITWEEAKEMIENTTGYALLDVRTPEEYAQGHIKGAKLVPGDELAAHTEDYLPDKDQPVLLYCRTGRRSATAAWMLYEKGYKNIYDFGGLTEWPYEIEK